METQIKRLTSEDEKSFLGVYDSWSELERKENRIFQKRSELAEDLAQGVAYGYFSEAELCGFLTLAQEGPVWEILLVLVKNQQQGRGVAGSLIDAIIQEARATLIPEIWLEVYSRNDRAIKLYQRKQFIPQKIRPTYYRDGSPALNMCCFLEDTLRI